MTHGIFTSTGNLVAWFDTEDEALAALGDLVAEEPEAADEIAAIPFDDEGRACGPAIKGSTLLPPARTLPERADPDASLRRGHGLVSDPREQRLAGEQRPRPTLRNGMRRRRASSYTVERGTRSSSATSEAVMSRWAGSSDGFVTVPSPFWFAALWPFG